MSPFSTDPITTLPDGSQILISTNYSKENGFICELYMANPDRQGQMNFKAVSGHFYGSTCLEAQEFAYGTAQHQFPKSAVELKKPPYLMWKGPTLKN